MKQESVLNVSVRSLYELQHLRIATGNRICAAFRVKLGLEPSQAEKEDKEAEKLLSQLRSEYSLITDGIKRVTKNTRPSGELITTVAEMQLIESYERLVESENVHEKIIAWELDKEPLWTEWMVDVRGLGPKMAGVILTEIDITKCDSISALWKYCFPKGTLVSTPNGMRSIDDLVEGDMVFDANGEVTNIKETMRKQYTGKMVTVETTGTLPLTMTEEHPVLVQRGNDYPIWMDAKDIKSGDKLVVPTLSYSSETKMDFSPSKKAASKNQKLAEGITVTPDVAYILGRYVGDGSASVWEESIYKRGIIQVAFAEEESIEVQNYVESVKENFGAARSLSTDSGYGVDFGRYTVASKFQEWFGHLAHNKKLPNFVMGLTDEETIRAFLRGYFDTDGHLVKDGKSKGSLTASSASEGLIFQLQTLIGKLGVFASIHKQIRSSETTVIRGREINQRKDRFILSVPASESNAIYPDLTYEGNRVARKVEHSENGSWLLTVKRVLTTDVEDVTVFNLHTGTNTYLVQNLAVHNCGLDVVVDAETGEGQGRTRKTHHLVDKVYTNKDGVETHAKGISFNPTLKTKMVGVLGGSFIKQGGKYRDIYDGYKHRIANHPKHAEKTPGHRHAMANRYAVKMFLQDLWLEWRRIEGLPIREPYAVEKLGIVHSK